MEKQYIIIKNVTVTEAAVHSGFYSAGAPPMTAIAGMSHALQLRLSESLSAVSAPSEDDFDFGDTPKVEFAITGITPVIAAYHLSEGPSRRVNYEIGTKKGQAAPVGFDPIADMVVDLIMRVETSLSKLELEALMSGAAANVAIHSVRFAGGSMFWNGQFAISPQFSELLDLCANTSIIIEDATAHLAQHLTQNVGVTVAQAIDQLTSRPVIQKDVEDSAIAKQFPYEPRHIALGVGYRALESQPRTQEYLKDSAPHLFVEPVLGLGRSRLVASVKKSLKKSETVPVVWAYQKPTDQGYYLVSGEKP